MKRIFTLFIILFLLGGCGGRDDSALDGDAGQKDSADSAETMEPGFSEFEEIMTTELPSGQTVQMINLENNGGTSRLIHVSRTEDGRFIFFKKLDNPLQNEGRVLQMYTIDEKDGNIKELGAVYSAAAKELIEQGTESYKVSLMDVIVSEGFAVTQVNYDESRTNSKTISKAYVETVPLDDILNSPSKDYTAKTVLTQEIINDDTEERFINETGSLTESSAGPVFVYGFDDYTTYRVHPLGGDHQETDIILNDPLEQLVNSHRIQYIDLEKDYFLYRVIQNEDEVLRRLDSTTGEILTEAGEYKHVFLGKDPGDAALYRTKDNLFYLVKENNAITLFDDGLNIIDSTSHINEDLEVTSFGTYYLGDDSFAALEEYDFGGKKSMKILECQYIFEN